MRPDPRGPTTQAERTLESFKLFTRCLPVLRNQGRPVNRSDHFSSWCSVFRRTEHPPKSFLVIKLFQKQVILQEAQAEDRVYNQFSGHLLRRPPVSGSKVRRGGGRECPQGSPCSSRSAQPWYFLCLLLSKR